MKDSKKSRAMKTATGIQAAVNTYYDKKFIENLKSNSSFFNWHWNCACGQLSTHTYGARHLPLCDGCDFRLIVMRAAGREEEFWKDYKAKRKEPEVIDILKRHPLPAKQGSQIQMYNYTPVKKP